jgi:hypothetical protein
MAPPCLEKCAGTPVSCNAGFRGLALCLFGGDALAGGMKPVAIVISFDVGKPVMPASIPHWITSLVHEFAFDRAEAAFHRSVALRRLRR